MCVSHAKQQKYVLWQVSGYAAYVYIKSKRWLLEQLGPTLQETRSEFHKLLSKFARDEDIAVRFWRHTQLSRKVVNPITTALNRGADKSLARPGRKQAWKHVRDARDFNNIETRALIKFFFPARQGAEGNSRNSDTNISLFPSWSG